VFDDSFIDCWCRKVLRGGRFAQILWFRKVVLQEQIGSPAYKVSGELIGSLACKEPGELVGSLKRANLQIRQSCRFFNFRSDIN